MAAGTTGTQPYLDRAKQELHAAEINIREAIETDLAMKRLEEARQFVDRVEAFVKDRGE
jgi:hypothetical protein